MADYGLKISKPGFDVKTCGDDGLVFSSEMEIFTKRDGGSFTKTVSATSSATETETHNLGEKVCFIVYFEDPTNSKYFQTFGDAENYQRESTDISVWVDTDDNDITFHIYNGYGTSQDIPVYWEYFYENV